jgi:AraC-like DNA-binding protein
MVAETYIVESATTEQLAPGEGADFWSEHVTSYQCEFDYGYVNRRDFRAGTIRQRSEMYQLVEFWSNEIVYRRTARQVRQDPDEDYRLLVPVAGELVIHQHDNVMGLAQGAGGALSMGSPLTVVQDSPAKALLMTIPSNAVTSPLNLSSPLATGFDMARGLGKVMRTMLTSLFEERDVISPAQFDAVCDRVVELLCMLVVGDDRPDAPGHLVEVEALIRRYARAHAADPGLTGTSIAHALGWSLRHVQHALQLVGTTPRDLIREERLQLVRQRLHDPAYRHMSITDLAYASGFSSISTFNPAFRQRFGGSPRDVRRSSDVSIDPGAPDTSASRGR